MPAEAAATTETPSPGSGTPGAGPSNPNAPGAANTPGASPSEKPTLDAAFGSIEKLFPDDPSNEIPTERKEEPAKTGEDKGGEAPPQDPAQQKPPGEQQPGRVKAATLREAKDRAEAEAKALRTEVETLKKQLSEPKANPDKEKWDAERADYQKRLDELETELRFTNYERSQEYKEKYETPFVRAWNAGQQKAAGLKVVESPGEADPVTGERTGAKMRQGTKEDFDVLMQIGDDDAAAEFAQQRFGAKAPLMLYHREQVQALNSARLQAIDDFRKQGVDREKNRMEQTTQQEKQISEAWTRENTAAIEKYPNWFKPVEGDDKGNELLERGFKLADLAFSNDIQKMPLEKRVQIWSAVRNKAAGFDRLAQQNRALQDQIKELQAKLEGFEDTEALPGQGGGKGGKQDVNGYDSVDAMIDKMAQV